MGLIRKTLSISTLGLVSWHSKKERLAAVSAELDLTRADLEQATEKHAKARERLAEAERRAREAELLALRDARRARRSGRKEIRSKVGRRRVAAATLRDKVNPLLDSTRESTQRFAAEHQPALDDAVSEAKARGRKARAAAEKRAKKLRKRAKATAEETAASVRDRADELTSH